MEYTIKEYKNYNEHEILDLYRSVGWINYTNHPEMLRNAFAHSLKVYAAFIKDKLAGVIRIVGDGYSVIFIQDILIFPEYQRNGIGTALLKHVLDEYQHVYQKHLLTENSERTIQFYKSLGFMMDTEIECRAFSKYF